jgi:hypothetical protein
MFLQFNVSEKKLATAYKAHQVELSVWSTATAQGTEIGKRFQESSCNIK